MVGKVSERVLAREGLERTDNGMKQSSWPEVVPINQKNYYTEYMKRDDQFLGLRIQQEQNTANLIKSHIDKDRALNRNGELPLPDPDEQGQPAEEGEAEAEAEAEGSRVIVIHPGSQNLRIGLASYSLPKTTTMCIATKYPQTESEEYEALPRRQFEAQKIEQKYGEEWTKKYRQICEDLKIDMRANKRKVLPNSKDLVVNFNRRTDPEIIPQHNDPLHVDWTEVEHTKKAHHADAIFYGHKAQRIPDNSDPKYRLWWPVQHGWLNEDGYSNVNHLTDDFQEVLEQTIEHELGIRRGDCKHYASVFVIPDLYDKKYVEQVLQICLDWFGFQKVAFIQESLAATYGAGYAQGCVVDIGAQKTSIACVEEGMVIEDSRINMKVGGFDVTETFIKMMLFDHFPYQDINLQRRYDFLLAEELKIKHCTMTQAEISVQLYQFHLRTPEANQPTRKYQFKTYDEVILAPMGFFDPSIFDNSAKLRGRRKLIDRSHNAYDVDLPDDPTSAAQTAILEKVKPSPAYPPAGGANGITNGLNGMATPSKEKPQPFNLLSTKPDIIGTPSTSKAASPAPEGSGTPAPFVFGGNRDVGSPAPNGQGTPVPGGGAAPAAAASFDFSLHRNANEQAKERDTVLPAVPLDIAIMTSIMNAAKGDERKLRDFAGSIMTIGGGSKIPFFAQFLEEKLKACRPDLAEKILVSPSAKEMDEQVLVWKGASVFAKLGTNDSWITPQETEVHGARTLHSRVMWNW